MWNYWKDWIALGVCVLVGVAGGIVLGNAMLQMAIEDQRNRNCVCECDGDLVIRNQ